MVRKASLTQPGKAKVAGPGKFAGIVEVERPAQGLPVRNGQSVVVALRALHLGKLPEMLRGEVQVEVGVRTAKGDGEEVSVQRESGVFHYVEDDSALNVTDWVLYSGAVVNHLTLEFEVTEVEDARKKTSEQGDLATALAAAAGQAGVGDPASAVASIFGAILRANADDQVLKYHTSLYSAEMVDRQKTLPPLLEGTYRFWKKQQPADPRDSAQVTFSVEVVSSPQG